MMRRWKVVMLGALWCVVGIVSAATAGQQIRLEKTRVKPGDTMTVYFSGAPGHAKDWVGLYPESAPPNRSWLSWQYTAGARSGQLDFTAPTKPGRYNFRLFENDGYRLLATGPSFVVEKAASAPPPSPPAACRVEIEKSAVKPGETVSVSFFGAPGHAKDWVGLYPKSAPSDRSWLSWKYTAGARSGQLSFAAPDEPGRYNFRLFENDGYKLLAIGPSFVVAKAAPAEPVDIGGSWAGSKDLKGRLNFWQNGREYTVVMSWPQGNGKWITVKGDGRIEGRSLTFKTYTSNTLGGKAAETPFTYHLRVAEDNQSITGYYTNNGVRMQQDDFYYFRVK